MTFKLNKTDMLMDAVEHYIYSMKKNNCNQAAIDVYTELLNELEKRTKMTNPFFEFKHTFEVWLCSVFGVYSQDFYSYYQSYIDFPEEYRQQELTALFWFTLNMGWEFMQPDMIIDYQEEFNSFE